MRRLALLLTVPFSVVCTSAPWSARYAHTVVSSRSTVLLMGGIGWWNASDKSRALRDVWSSPDLGVSWTKLTDEAPFGIRQGASSALVNYAVLLIAGETLMGDEFSDGQHDYTAHSQQRAACATSSEFE